MTICNICKQQKEEVDFYKSSKTKCKECIKQSSKIWQLKNKDKRAESKQKWRKQNIQKIREQQNKWNKARNTNIEYRFNQWRKKAKERGIEFDLTLEYVKQMPMICFYSGQELTLDRNKTNTISLDRLDSSKPYSRGNVVFCCADVNRMKFNFEKQYFIDLCKTIANHNK